MAALFSTQRLVARKSALRFHEICIYFCQSYSATHEGTHASDFNVQDLDHQKARIYKLRNVSRLSERHYKQYHGQPFDVPYKDLLKRRMRYAQFGMASGEDARIMWPSRGEILDQEAEEKEESMPLLETLAQLRSKREADEKEKSDRCKEIAKNMTQMPKWIEEYKKKQEKSELEAKAKAAKKEALLEEARDHFGYKIQAHDPKFKQMLEEREEQDKKEAKKRKKEEKKKRQLVFQQQAEVSKTTAEAST